MAFNGAFDTPDIQNIRTNADDHGLS